jgi:hypothetical protein
MQLEFDVTHGTMPTVVAKLLQLLQVGRDEEVDLVRLLARLLVYTPTERPAAKETGQVARGEWRYQLAMGTSIIPKAAADTHTLEHSRGQENWTQEMCSW